jgi:ABC-type Na+ efflux pump permease subunit
MYTAVTIALIEFFAMLVASVIQSDPTPLVQSLNPLSTVFILLALSYHLYLIFNTMSLAAHSITREKEAQTWEMLILTGIDARQIVLGKWWAIVQYQLPRYVLLSVLRMGMVAIVGIVVSTAFSPFPYSYYNIQTQLAHPVTIVFVGVIGFAFSAANLGLCAACGIMASAISKRSTLAIVRGFANQIVLSVGLALAGLLFINRLYDFRIIRGGLEGYVAATTIPLSFIDNGILGSVSYVGPFATSYYEQLPPPVIKPVAIEWIVSALISIAIYALIIRFVLWRAEKNAVRDLATSYSRSSYLNLSE